MNKLKALPLTKKNCEIFDNWGGLRSRRKNNKKKKEYWWGRGQRETF